MVENKRQHGPHLVVDNAVEPDATVPDFIAENLRRLYRDTEAEPLPPQLRALLDRLAAEEAAETVGKE
jgi:hypothetical protein